MNKMMRCAKLIVPAVLAVCFAAPVLAANRTFTGTGNFSTPARWSKVPVAGDNLRIDGNCTVDNTGGLAYATLVVGNGANGTLLWPAGGTATLNVTTVSTASGRTGIIDMTNGGTLQISTSWTPALQTFVPGTGTVNWNVTGGISTLPVSPITAYNNLTIAATGKTASLGVATTVNGNLLISTGTLSVSGSNFALAVKGNFTNSGSGFTPGTGTVTFNGTAAQALGGTTATIFNNLTINKTIGDVMIISTSAALSPTVNGALTLTSGHVITTVGTNDLGSGPLGTVSAAPAPSNASHVVGDMQRTFPNNASSFTFPIGDGTNYQPVTIALTGATAGTLNAHVDSGDHPDTIANLSGIDQTKSANHYWTLTPGTLTTYTSYAATLQFCAATTCTNAERDATATVGSFKVAKKNAGAWIRSTVGTPTANTIQATGITSAQGFGEFAVGEPLVGVYKGVNQLIDLREVY